jgi:hypothetical protein
MKKHLLTCLAFVGLCTSHSALAQTPNRWHVDKSLSGFQIAKVVNSGNSAAGIICNLTNEACDAYLTTDVGCEEDEKIPLMINSSIGAFQITAKCMIFSQIKLLVIVEFDNAIQAFESGGEIGFAMPMISGQFRVIRFGTVGAKVAINSARTRPEKKPTTRRLRQEESL